MIIDLSMRLNSDTPIYPGDPSLKIETAATFEKDAYVGHSLQMGTHTGTHIDAPAHMLPNSKTLGKFSADKFVGRGRYVLVNYSR